MAQGEGQTLADEHFKEEHPKEWDKLKSQPDKWKKLIGKEEAADASFRKFEIKYSLR